MILKYIAILGSTGSIGTQALDVIEAFPENFAVSILTANNNADLLIKQAIKFQPKAVHIGNNSLYSTIKESLSKYNIDVFTGNESLIELLQNKDIPTDIVLASMVGFAGLIPTIEAIKCGKTIALANKETLVVAGEQIMELAKQNNVKILPVDSEHSAIFQCLAGEEENPIEKIYITASGGPFRGKNKEYLEKVTRKEALKHPNWDMGAKITIDSASLMNKGLEAIEARWLFNLEKSQIDVIVHPQSIIHSIVQFCDGSMKAQMGLPDMKLPIQYAICYPHRKQSKFKRFNFMDYPALTFEKPDLQTFHCLTIAFASMEKAGNAPCVMNAANEIAVDAFLKEKIKFTQIPQIIENVLNKVEYIMKPTIQDYLTSNEIARIIAKELIK